MRMPYRKPQIQSARMESIGRKASSALIFDQKRATSRARFRSGKIFYIRKNVDSIQLSFIKELLEHGLNVERPLFDTSVGKNNAMPFENLGQDLQKTRRQIQNLETKEPGKSNARKRRIKAIIRRQLPLLVGRMHAQAIKHNHLNERNFTIKKGKLGLIDFSESFRMHVDWNSADRIYQNFRLEYFRLLHGPLLEFEFDLAETKEIFVDMIKEYPTTDSIRAQILQNMEPLLPSTNHRRS